MRSFTLKARMNSFKCAFTGGRVLLASQHNSWIHALATVMVLTGAVLLRVSMQEWALLIFSLCLVWAMESMNTAIEFLADEISLEHRERIGKAKDVAAFGVLISAVAAVVIGFIVFVPYLSSFWRS